MKVTYSFIRELLEPFEKTNDVYVSYYSQGIEVNVNDWEGFNEYWEEIKREYDLRVEIIQDFLKLACIKTVEELYKLYVFDDFTVSWGYCSYDV